MQSKDSENLEKSLYAWEKGENQYIQPGTVGSSVSTTLKHKLFTVIEVAAWVEDHFWKTLKHILPSTNAGKALSCKKQAMYEHDPEMPLSFLGQRQFKID